MAGIPLPQMSIDTPPPQVVTAKKPEIAGDESTGYKVGAGMRDIIGKGADAAADAVAYYGNTRLDAVKTVAGAVAKPVVNFGKGLFGVPYTPTPDVPTDAPVAPAAAAVPAPAANPASKVTMDLPPQQVPYSGTIGGPTPAPAQTSEQYPTAPPQSISQYLPQLMAAAASQDTAPVQAPVQNPFRAGGTWDDFLTAKHKNVQNAASVAAFNAATQRRTADTGVLNALTEPLKADANNQTQLATTGMTANTARATNAETTAAHLAAAKLSGTARLESAKELASARRYGADQSVKGKGSAVQKSISPDGKIVLTQLNSDGQLATHIIDPQNALAHQQADRAVMAANNGDEIDTPQGGKGIVKIVNGVRRVYDKKTGQDIGWTPPVRFSAVGMPPAGGGGGGAAADEISEALNN